jgi:hypothetical protein
MTYAIECASSSTPNWARPVSIEQELAIEDCAKACLAVVGFERFEVLRLSAELWARETLASAHAPNIFDGTELMLAIRVARIYSGTEEDLARNYISAVAETVLPEIAPSGSANKPRPVYEKPIRCGFVYVLTNPSLSGMVKIGMTTGTVHTRAKELSRSTSIPTPFKIHAFFESKNPAADEARAHEALQDARVPSSEFFRVSPEHAAEICGLVVGGAQ